ncbi:MAG: F0F1 ATP synthase subunit alpha [Sandaracinaceae bacterium]|nr:F0F1 ATP synthase subunit alpha [Sandaracinaceae bacterium]
MTAELRASLASLAERGVDVGARFRAKGVVRQIGDGVLTTSGIPELGYQELLRLDGGALAIAMDVGVDEVGAALLTKQDATRAGDGAVATGELPSIPVGEALLGRLIDASGAVLDGGPPLPRDRAPVFRPPPELTERAPVNQPLHTGVTAIDAAIPIGRGQRQLLIGDRNVGKTALALDIVAAQAGTDVRCVYVVVGQPLSRVLALRDTLESAGALRHTTILCADSSRPPGLQYIAPYAGATVAEHFRDRGEHALLVIDDLTKHADAYRELALLLGRPPGREAYPGDIFNVHAELLERATAMSAAGGGGTLTAIPIAETTDGDISAYIPTNLISITDGQLYLDSGRFERNLRPAIDIGRSVSRVGGAAQTPELRAASHNLRIAIARFESLEGLSRVGLDVDARAQVTLRRGRQLRELLRQPRFSARSRADEIASLVAITEGHLDGLEPAVTSRVLERALRCARDEARELVAAFTSAPREGWEPRWVELLRAARETEGRREAKP